VKLYGGEGKFKGHENKYSPVKCTRIKKRKIGGNPDMGDVSPSYVERQNRTMRMGMCRFTRLTNGFSKGLKNQIHMLSLYFVHYTFVRIHNSLEITPAMAAGVSDRLHDVEWIAGLIDARAPAPKKHSPHKRRAKPKIPKLGHYQEPELDWIKDTA